MKTELVLSNNEKLLSPSAGTGLMDEVHSVLANAAYSFAGESLEGASQLLNRASSGLIPEAKLQAPPPDSLGTIIGSIAKVALIDTALGRLAPGLASRDLLRATADGAAFALLQPVSNTQENFALGKLLDAGTGAATFAIMSGTGKIIGKAADALTDGARPLLSSITANAISGYAGGVFAGEASSLRSGNGLALNETINDNALKWAALGAGFAALGRFSSGRTQESASSRVEVPGSARAAAENLSAYARQEPQAVPRTDFLPRFNPSGDSSLVNGEKQAVSTRYPRTILLFRHLEKPDEGSGLSPLGQEHAKELAKWLPREFGTPDYIFATKSTGESSRPYDTVEPLSEATGVKIKAKIDDADYEKLATKLLTKPKYADKLVAVCWHHGKLPDLAAALHAPPGSFPEHWPADTFNLMLKFDYKGSAEPQVTRITEPFDDSAAARTSKK